jgi:hypothetical protein
MIGSTLAALVRTVNDLGYRRLASMANAGLPSVSPNDQLPVHLHRNLLRFF